MASLEILEYRGLKEKFFGFCKIEEKCPNGSPITNYYLLYGKTAGITIECSQETADILYQNQPISSIILSKTLEMEIPFLLNEKRHACTLIPIKDRQEYNRIVQIMEDLL